jgi:hypothetical protein
MTYDITMDCELDCGDLGNILVSVSGRIDFDEYYKHKYAVRLTSVTHPLFTEDMIQLLTKRGRSFLFRELCQEWERQYSEK